METAAKLARAGNRLLAFIAVILVLLMLLYGGYSLWDTAMIFQGGFIDDELMAIKPIAAEGEEAPSFEDLLAINEDVCAWITVDDTHIDYPVVQGDDDMEYINKNVYGEFEMSGAIFLSILNKPDFSESYILTYGHHMDGGGMYGDVAEFVDAAYFNDRTTGQLLLPDRIYDIEIFACVTADAYDKKIYSPDVQSNGNMDSFVKYIREMAVQYRDIGVTGADKIIGLSTCSDASTNGRIILFGRLVE